MTEQCPVSDCLGVGADMMRWVILLILENYREYVCIARVARARSE